MRLYKVLGDSRAAWSSYLDEFCRNPRALHKWRPHADCIVPLVLTFLGIMDGSSDVERNFSQMTLLECRRARRHHTEQVFQDLLKIRLHIPDELRNHGGDPAWSRGMVAFLHRAQANYGEFFGLRRLASRSMVPVDHEEKLALLLWRRPRWQYLALKKKGAPKTRAARLKTWESDVQRLVGERRLVAKEDSFVAHADVDADSLLEHMSQVMAAKGMQQKLAQQEAERTGKLFPPPPPVRKKQLMTPSAGKCKPALGLKRKLAGPKLATPSAGKCKPTLGRKGKLAGPKLAEQKVEKPPQQKTAPRICIAHSTKRKGTRHLALLEGVCFPENLRVHFSLATSRKHRHLAAYLVKKGFGLAQIGMESPSGKTRGAPVPDPGTPGRVRNLPDRFREFSGRAGTKPAEDRARKLAPSHFGVYVR